MNAGGDGVNGWSGDPGGARQDTRGHLAITIRQCQLSDAAFVVWLSRAACNQQSQMSTTTPTKANSVQYSSRLSGLIIKLILNAEYPHFART